MFLMGLAGPPAALQRSALFVLMVAVWGVAGCTDSLVKPGASGSAVLSEGPGVEVPGSFLEPGVPQPTGTPIAERTITIGATEGTDGTLDAMLWNPGDVDGPMVVEVTSELGLTGQAPFFPASDPINYSLLLWWNVVGVVYAPGVPAGAPADQPLTVEILLGRYISLQFFSVGSDGSRIRDTTFVPGNGTTVELLDSTAAGHGLGMQWEYPPYQGTSYGDHPPNPLCLDPTMRCVPLPSPDSPGRFGPGPPTGTLIVRVYHAGTGEPLGVRVTVEKVEGPNEGGSFTTKAGEGTIRLVATVAPDSFASHVVWHVENDPDYAVAPVLPTAPPTGATAQFEVVAPDIIRWKAFNHPGQLSQKSLAYRVRAVVQVAGTTHSSAAKDVVQNEQDTMRQEYIDYSVPLPPAGDLRQPMDIIYFRWSELNHGDYNVGYLSGDLIKNLPALRDSLGKPVVLTSGFRNPVHQRWHIQVSGGGTPSPTSTHQQGKAVDIRTGSDSSVWRRISKTASFLGACIEPIEASTVDHVHAEWTGGRSTCKPGW